MKKILLFLLAATTAFATSAPKTHDGFFFNATMGLGYSSFSDDMDHGAATLDCQGAAYAASLKLGGTVYPNLILHFTMQGFTLFPDLEKKNKYGQKETLTHDGFKLFMMGGGLTYYFLGEQNLYVSASAGINDVSLELNAMDYKFENLDTGFSFMISIGKEWWINDEWGLGVSLTYNHYSASGDYRGEENKASANSFAVEATITFN